MVNVPRLDTINDVTRKFSTTIISNQPKRFGGRATWQAGSVGNEIKKSPLAAAESRLRKKVRGA